MRLSTPLPLTTLFFPHWGLDDAEIGVVVAKARFRRGPDGNFWADPEAPALAQEDRFDGDPATSALVAEQDLAPGKAATDLLIRAVARAPGGHPASDWPVSVTLPGRPRYEFQVRGPCDWQRRNGGWRQSVPAPVAEVTLSYALAYGGTVPDSEGGLAAHPLNPAGLGFATPALLEAGAPFAAPQIGDLAEFMQSDPLATMMVHGLGPIAKGWLPRRGHAGTFDEAWRRSRHPRMPRDYNFRFWNAAPGPLQLPAGALDGATIELRGIAPHVAPVMATLPPVGLVLVPGGGAARAMTLDTVDLDLRAPDPSGHVMALSWRVQIEDPGRFAAAEIVQG